jgi:hypothetical protein
MGTEDKSKPSISSQPNSAALITVEGSELDFYTNSNYLLYELAKYAAAQRSGKLPPDDPDDDSEDGEDGEEEEEEEEKEEEDGEEGETKGRPSLSDIEIVSNEVIRGVGDLPTAKIVFKVKNSSGVKLKAINVRVEKK